MIEMNNGLQKSDELNLSKTLRAYRSLMYMWAYPEQMAQRVGDTTMDRALIVIEEGEKNEGRREGSLHAHDRFMTSMLESLHLQIFYHPSLYFFVTRHRQDKFLLYIIFFKYFSRNQLFKHC